MTQHNPQDPLNKAAPPEGQALFKTMNELARGYSSNAVVDAAVNLLINAIRQTYPKKDLAEQRWDQIVGQHKETLLSHYDSVTGNRRSIFPFTQYINMPTLVDKDIFHGEKKSP